MRAAYSDTHKTGYLNAYRHAYGRTCNASEPSTNPNASSVANIAARNTIITRKRTALGSRYHASTSAEPAEPYSVDRSRREARDTERATGASDSTRFA